MKTPSLASGAVLVGLLIAGCGGSSKPPSLSEFKSGFQADKVQFRQLGLDLQRAIVGAKGETDAQLATELSTLSTRSSDQATRLKKLNPPPKFKGELQSLVAAFNAVSVDLKAISQAAAKHDATGARSETETLLKDAAKVKSSDDSLTSGLGLPAR